MIYLKGYFYSYFQPFILPTLVHRTTNHSRQICQFRSTLRRKIASDTKSQSNTKDDKTCVYGRCELDSHADTIVAGANCVILQHTGKECDVSPYREDYDSIPNVPIVHAATAWQSNDTGQTYILVFHEALWMGPSLEHSLINPNQLRHYGTRVQDDPTSPSPLSIITEEKDFCMPLHMDGTIVYTDTYSPSDRELETCPHIIMLSPHPWNPHTVKFPTCERTLEDEVGGLRFISEINVSPSNTSFEDTESLFNLDSMRRRISGMRVLNYDKDIHTRPPGTDSGATDIKLPNTFTSSDRHSDVSPQDLSSRWGISIPTAVKTLKHTTQKFLRSALLPLGQRYQTDRLFSRKTLRGKWSTDTLDGRRKSLAGNRYAQVFANKGYFSKIYPMDSKRKAGQALREFCNEFGVPEHLTFDGSKEQCSKGTEFMKQIRTHDIDYHISEANLHNQNPVEGTIRELRRKWYRLMIAKRVSEEFWDYGLIWVSETSLLTFSSAGSINGGIPIENVT